jgi:hypothetical protein
MLHIIKFNPMEDDEPVPILMSVEKLEKLEKEKADNVPVLGVMYDKHFSLDEVKAILKAVGAEIIVSFSNPIENSNPLWEAEVPGITEFIEPSNFFGLLVPETVSDSDLDSMANIEEYRDYNYPDTEFFDELGKELCLKLLDYWDFTMPGYSAFSDYVKENM